nr:CidA/LrgA family protein [Acinetobacter qingfengensis]
MKPQTNLQLLFKVIAQLVLLSVFWWLGCLLHQFVFHNISAGILGMFILLLCLFTGLIKLEWVELGSQAILKELVLFFLPVVVAVVQYKSLFLKEGWQLILSIGVGTMLVMVSTSLCIHYLYRLQKYLRARKRLNHSTH